MSERFSSAISSLVTWLKIHAIQHDSLAVILKFGSSEEARDFEAALKCELADVIHYQETELEMRLGEMRLGEMKIRGLKIRIESPLHVEPGDE